MIGKSVWGRIKGVRAIAGLMLVAASLALVVGSSPDSFACDCKNYSECVWAGLCYSPGACAPDGTHRSCQQIAGNPPPCGWYHDAACP
jgi:hypothetical protein